MAWLPIIDEAEATGLLARLYADARKRAGRVYQILKVSSLVPVAIDAYIRLYKTVVMRPGKLPRADREMLAVVVSQENGCFY